MTPVTASELLAVWIAGDVASFASFALPRLRWVTGTHVGFPIGAELEVAGIRGRVTRASALSITVEETDAAGAASGQRVIVPRRLARAALLATAARARDDSAATRTFTIVVTRDSLWAAKAAALVAATLGELVDDVRIPALRLPSFAIERVERAVRISVCLREPRRAAAERLEQAIVRRYLATVIVAAETQEQGELDVQESEGPAERSGHHAR